MIRGMTGQRQPNGTSMLLWHASKDDGQFEFDLTPEQLLQGIEELIDR
jgi:hypothetical protein